MRDLYLISTFRHEWNRAFNLKIAPRLEAKGFHCYFAHRDTNQKGSPDEIFMQDLAGMSNCSIVLAVAENESPNWGAEVGFAYGRKVPIVALTQREHQIPLILNGMVTECIRVSNLDDIDQYIDELASLLKKHIESCRV